MPIYNVKWFVMLTIALLCYAFHLGKKYHWSAGILFGYVGVNTLMVAVFPYNLYSQFPNLVKKAMAGDSAISLVMILLLIIFVDNFKMKNFLKFFLAVQILNAGYVIVQSFSNIYLYRVGFFDNISLNGGLIALSVSPILYSKKPAKLVFFAMILTAVILSKASIPFGVMGVTIASFYIMKKRKFVLPIIIFLSLIGMATFFDANGDLPFYQKARFEIYNIQTKAFFKDDVCFPERGKLKCVNKGSILTGYGQGTYPFWAFLTQVSYYLSEGLGRSGELFNFVHSDWLQIMLENGIMGLILSLIFAFYLVKMSWGNPVMFSLLIGYYAFMIYCYPLHYPFHALTGLWIASTIMLNYKENPSIIFEEGKH